MKLKKILNKPIRESFSTTADNTYGKFIIDILAIRDQSHIFHWQTNSFAEHKAFGKFYEEYLDLVDELVEMIMGLNGTAKVGLGIIELHDYTPENIKQFFDKSYIVFKNDILEITKEEEILDQSRLVVAQLDKLKYLLTLK
jgi:DNA-binding ferritin-like protein